MSVLMLFGAQVGELHRNDARYALLLLAYAVDDIRTGDSMLVVRDDEEL